MFVSTNPWKFGTEVVLCCIVFLLYSSWSLPFLTNRSNHKGCQASKPKAALRYLSHLLVWHVVVDVVAMMEAAVKASPENERRMKFSTREHKNCYNSGWVSCQPWESAVGDVRREVRSGYGFANYKVPTAFPFCRNQVSSRCGSLETPNFKRNLDTQCPICSFSAEASMNETKLLPWIFTLVLFVCLCSQKS